MARSILSSLGLTLMGGNGIGIMDGMGFVVGLWGLKYDWCSVTSSFMLEFGLYMQDL